MTQQDPHDYSWLPDDVLEFIAKTIAAYPEDAVEFTIAQQREFYDKMCAAFDPPHPEGLSFEDKTIAGVACRVYRPATCTAKARVIYFHGGGFIVGGLHSHDAICAELAHLGEVELIAVDYRLVPEHLHPAAYEDARAVVQAVAGPKVLMGDSAGGNLAAAVSATCAPDAHEIHGQILIYPGLGGDLSLPSYSRHAFAPMLSRAEIEYYGKMRYGGEPPVGDVSASPLQADSFEDLPRTAIFTAQADPLASDGVEYAARLSEAGVTVSLTEEPGLVHGYLRARHSARAAKASFERITDTLRDMLGHIANVK